MMIWNGKPIKTIGMMCDALKDITTKEAAAEFLALARAEGPNADQDIGYLFGYFSRERWKELSELFGILHPVFGDRYGLTDDEIMAIGMKRGEALREKYERQK